MTPDPHSSSFAICLDPHIAIDLSKLRRWRCLGAASPVVHRGLAILPMRLRTTAVRSRSSDRLPRYAFLGRWRCTEKIARICNVFIEDSRSERLAIDRSRINIQTIEVPIGNAALHGRVAMDYKASKILFAR